MSEASLMSKATITIGRSGQDVNLEGDEWYEFPRAGAMRFGYRSDLTSERQSMEESFKDLHICDPKRKSTITVESFLDALQFDEYYPYLMDLDINTLFQMKEDDLKDRCIPKGPRKRILRAISALPKPKPKQ